MKKKKPFELSKNQKEETLKINMTLWKKVMEKMKIIFKKEEIADVTVILIVCLLGCYMNSKKKIKISKDDKYLGADHPDEIKESNYETKKVRIPAKLVDNLKKTWNAFAEKEKNRTPGLSDIINALLISFNKTPIEEYTNCIAPLYSIVGSKNQSMQKETANAVENMNLNHQEMIYIEGCCATGALFFGLQTYSWKQVILNDMNPLRTNFLNVLLKKPMELIKRIMETDLSLIEESDERKEIRRKFQADIDEYYKKRERYHKVDCNVEIAYEMFIFQCIDKKFMDNEEDIWNKVLRFLPAHLKMLNANTIITQEDCKNYLTDDISSAKLPPVTDRLLLLDPPYMGSEHQCNVKNYNYKTFHKKVAAYLETTKYPFIYYCRSSAPKSNKVDTLEKAQHIMKVKLGECFWDKGFYFSKVQLQEDVTELMISNRHYDSVKQFQWTDFRQDIR